MKRPTRTPLTRAIPLTLAAAGLLLALLACRDLDEGAAVTASPPPTRASVTRTSTPVPTGEPTVTPRPSSTPSPTPPVPGLTVADQTLGDDGQLTIARVVSDRSAWLVIQTLMGEAPGPILVAVPITAGVTGDLSLSIDPLAATEHLQALLLLDAGEPGEFDGLESEPPILVNGEPVRQAFRVTIDVRLPAILVSDQEVGTSGLVRVAAVTATATGWLALHTDQAGEPGDLLAYFPVRPGTSEGLVLAVNRFRATPRLYAILYLDEGEPGRFEPTVDRPVVVSGRPLVVPFAVTWPIDVLVLDQPVVEGRVVIDRVMAPTDAWLTIYSDSEDGVGRILGFAPLQSGINRAVVVEVATALVTPMLLVRLHLDTGETGVFDFPANDPPVMVDGRLPEPFTFRTDPGNYLLGRDQVLAEDGVLQVALVVVDLPVWVVVRADAAGEPGDVLGQRPLAPGLHRDVAVILDRAAPGEGVFVVLHRDAGAAGVFEFPDGPDIPLERNRQIIAVPLRVMEP